MSIHTNKVQCPMCFFEFNALKSVVWRWLRNKFSLTEIEISQNLVTGEFSMRKVRRTLFSTQAWGWREYKGKSNRINVPFEAMAGLAENARYWAKYGAKK